MALRDEYSDDTILGLSEAAELTGYSLGKFTYAPNVEALLAAGAEHEGRTWRIPFRVLVELGFMEGVEDRKNSPLKRGRPAGKGKSGGVVSKGALNAENEELAEANASLRVQLDDLGDVITRLRAELADVTRRAEFAETRYEDKENELKRIVKLAGLDV